MKTFHSIRKKVRVMVICSPIKILISKAFYRRHEICLKYYQILHLYQLGRLLMNKEILAALVLLFIVTAVIYYFYIIPLNDPGV